MVKKILPRQAIFVWRFRCTFLVCIATFIFGAMGIINISLCIVLLSTLFFFYLCVIFFYIPKRYLEQKYDVSDNKIYIEKGVYFKIKKFIPINKIQYVEIKISPDEKLWNLCTIVFSASGTKLVISQIEYPKALQIRKNLVLEDKNEI